MKQGEVLEIDLATETVVFAGKPLEVSGRFVQFLALLAQRTFQKTNFLGQQETIGVHDIAALESFRSGATQHLGSQLARFARNLKPGLVKSPATKSKNAFYLCADLVREVVFKQEHLTVPVVSTVFDAAQTKEWAALASCEALLESGQPQVARAALQGLLETVSPSLLARVRLILAESWLLEGQQREAYENLEAAQSALDVNPDVVSAGLFKVFQARLQWLSGEFESAEVLARSLLSEASPTIKARLENLLGLISMDKGIEPCKAEHHFQAALRFSTEAHWWWGVLATMWNLGSMAFRQAQHVTTLSLPSRPWLQRADYWFDQAIGLVKSTGFRYENPQVLIWAAMVKNELQQSDQAKTILLEALVLSDEKHAFHSELAKLEFFHTLNCLGADIKTNLQASNHASISSNEFSYLQDFKSKRTQFFQVAESVISG